MRVICRLLLGLLLALCLGGEAVAATLTFTVTASEPVTVTGTPRIAIDVGGVTRYASYASGSGTAALTFSYPVQAGDFDMDGITLVSPLELNGGSIADLAGNPMGAAAFTVPGTSNLKVQTYTVAFSGALTSANAMTAGITIDKSPANASYSYTITSDGGAGSVTGTGSTSAPQTSFSANVANLPSGTLTISLSISKTGAGQGTARTATVTPSFTGVLDGRVTPDVAYSLNRLRTAYSGPLIRVRRASDNSEQDMSAGTVAGGLNTTALLSFCGSSSCFVSAWYDQSGNGRHATQATTSLQPRIVSAGTVDRFNGVPAIYFNGHALVAASALPASTSVWSTHLTRIVGAGATGRGRVWGFPSGGNLATNSGFGDDYFGAPGLISLSVNTSPRILSLAVTGTGSASMWTNGSFSTSVASGVGFSGGQVLTLGNTSALDRAYNGNLHSVILSTGSYATADRQAIERWLGTLAGISVP